MKQHYFIGIKVPEHIAKAIVKEREKTNVHETHKIFASCRGLAYHALLLRACGASGSNINYAIFAIIQWKAFELTTNGLAHFGNEQTPRVIYTALEESNSLHDLQCEITHELSKIIQINKRKRFSRSYYDC